MSHLNTLVLHQLRYGELRGDALLRANEHLAACETCSSRLRAQEAERAAFVAAPVPDAIRAIGATAAPVRSWWRDWLPLAGALLAAASLSLVVREVRTDGVTSPEVATARPKGELPAVEVWVKRPEGTRPLREGEPVGSGDRIQLVYDPHGASAIALAGRDGSGRIEVYTTNAPTGIGLVRAPFALTLDDTPGSQELFVVGSDRALSEDEVKEAVAGAVHGARVGHVVLRKREGGGRR
ncbi:MAG: hypothetical protein H6738_16730 [Alphaproteobacteria bacterium]|nr:hypothetical protein [Alphaproteobacteria bacterium]MCB9698428.1 hypothetical protein [Alphaproteobacteria bacterium]